MQTLCRVKLTIQAYVQERFHERMRPPERCPVCGGLGRLWAHGFYERYSTQSEGKLQAFRVRRFRCRDCRITVSCLPCFAQPYRLVSHPTLEAFLNGQSGRRDVQAHWELLQRYRRRFVRWWPSLRQIVGCRFGRAGPKTEATGFWRSAVAVCGSCAELTMQLVAEFRTTCFRTYRCHQPAPAR